MRTRGTRSSAVLAVTLLAAALGGCAARDRAESTPPGATRGSAAKTVVFVHGMFVGPACWRELEGYFQAKGYRTIAPAWPEHDRPAAEQRARHPSAALAKVTMADVLARYREVIRGLDEPPILIGHSMGGLAVQMLMAEGLGSAGIVLDTAPPKGLVSLKHSFLKSNWPIIAPKYSIDEPIEMSEERFAYVFVNTLPPAEQHRIWTEYAQPESRRVGRTPTTRAGKVDHRQRKAPLLFVAGGSDHVIPASLVRRNWRRAKKSPAVTDYREFAGRDHWILAEPGWEEVGAAMIEWLEAR